MKKKLIINSAVCDVSRVSAQTVDAYEQITVNAGLIITSGQARALLARTRFIANTANTIDVLEGAVLRTHNGTFTIAAGPTPTPPVMLVVNGKLIVEPGAQEALAGYPAILVNGKAIYPKGLGGYLGGMQVNGKAIVYPEEAVLLKDAAVIDRLFALRARDRLYFAAGRMIITDPQLDAAALAAKGARLHTARAVITEQLLEGVAPLLNEEAQITVVPADCAYVQGDQQLTDQLLAQHGVRLFIDGDLLIPSDGAVPLSRLTHLSVQGDVLVPTALQEALQALNPSYSKLFAYRGHLVRDQVQLHLDAAFAALHLDGVTFMDCVRVVLDDDLPPQTIMETFRFVDCALIVCSAAQRPAVQSVSSDVVHVLARSEGDPADEHKEEDKDAEIINAASHVL